MSLSKKLGIRLKTLRAAYGLKQKDLAKLLNCSVSSVGEWEAGKKIIPSKYFYKIQDVLCVPFTFFDVKSEFDLSLFFKNIRSL